MILPTCPNTHAEKKSLMLKIAPTWRQLAHAAPKLRAKTFEKFLDETFLASTRSCCTSVSLFVPVHARRNARRQTSAAAECDLKCKQLQINHSPGKCSVPSHAEEERIGEERTGEERGSSNQRHSIGCCACVRRHLIVLNAKVAEITHTWIPALHMHMSARKHKLRDYTRVRECVCDGSQQQTHCWQRAFTHTHVCYVGVVVRSCPWWNNLSSTAPVPEQRWCETTSSRGGEMFDVALRGPRLY